MAVAQFCTIGDWFGSMKKLLYASTITALLATCCGSLNTPNHPSGLPLRYHNPQYGLGFSVPATWRGHSVLVQEWEGQTYSAAVDKVVVMERGPVIVLRHPQWKADAPYQDIPILVFTRSQWDALHLGKFWPSLYAGGAMDEIWHNRKYVFGMSSRYNWGELKGSKEAADVVERNRSANKMPHLYPE